MMTGSMTTNGSNPADGAAYSIGELADLYEITPRAIRFYEDRGLLAPRRAGRNRVYSDRDRVRLGFILRGKRLGISLAETREWLELYDMEDGERLQFEALLDGSRQRIAELEEKRDALEETLKELRDIERLALEGLSRQGDSKTASGSRAEKSARRDKRS